MKRLKHFFSSFQQQRCKDTVHKWPSDVHGLCNRLWKAQLRRLAVERVLQAAPPLPLSGGSPDSRGLQWRSWSRDL